MKKAGIVMSIYFGLVLIFYLMGSFISMSFDPHHWLSIGRGFVVLVPAMLTAAICDIKNII